MLGWGYKQPPTYNFWLIGSGPPGESGLMKKFFEKLVRLSTPRRAPPARELRFPALLIHLPPPTRRDSCTNMSTIFLAHRTHRILTLIALIASLIALIALIALLRWNGHVTQTTHRNKIVLEIETRIVVKKNEKIILRRVTRSSRPLRPEIVPKMLPPGFSTSRCLGTIVKEGPSAPGADWSPTRPPI